MSRLRLVLVVKGTFTLVVLALPLLFMPLEGIQLIGFPEYDEPASFFIRLLGATLVPLATFQLWTAIDVGHRKGGIFATLVECVMTLLVLWHFVWYGGMATWPIRGKLVAIGFGMLQAGFAAAILVTGWEALLGRGESRSPDAA
ncbi:MAG: hypothetical protein FJ144_02450 [Deltaproteobacteria bacterium]|nr:hypothetical protein [Deltaproteobacteria bacterium]